MYAQIFVLQHFLFLDFPELNCQKTVHFSEQIMSADKYSSTFSHQMETIVYTSRQLICLRSRRKILVHRDSIKGHITVKLDGSVKRNNISA